MKFKIFTFLLILTLSAYQAILLRPNNKQKQDKDNRSSRKLKDYAYTNPEFNSANIMRQKGFVYPKFTAGYGMMGPFDYTSIALPHAMNPMMHQGQPLFNPFFFYQSMMNPIATMMGMYPNQTNKDFYAGNYGSSSASEVQNIE